MDGKRKHDGIAGILASGRAPGMIVRGNGYRIQEHNRMPVVPEFEPAGRDAVQRERDAERLVAAKRRAHEERTTGRGASRKRDSALRYQGSMPFDQYAALCREVGRDAVHNDDRVWKDAGRLVDS